ncbi:MAG: hypothetical protein HC804_14515 [Anaerolineae bacterium]|nr:hypothetical protein [Anaerolineae bacterium]
MRAVEPTDESERRPSSSNTVTSLLLRLMFLFILDALAAVFIWQALAYGHYLLIAAAAVLTLGVNVAFLKSEFYPIRWMALGLVLMAMFAIYPIIFTIFIAFTNFGDGHLLTEEQAITQIERVRYLPETGVAFTWTAFQTPDGEYALWLIDNQGNSFLAKPGEEVQSVIPGEGGIGELDDKGIPSSIEGYERLNALRAAADANLGDIQFGSPDAPVQIRSPQEAAAFQQKYVYDAEQNVIVDQETGVIYTPINGTFTSPTGEELRPGFRATIGLQNFTDFLKSPALRGPLVLITVWNFVFAFLSVFNDVCAGAVGRPIV